jgi:hypothetical protein
MAVGTERQQRRARISLRRAMVRCTKAGAAFREAKEAAEKALKAYELATSAIEKSRTITWNASWEVPALSELPHEVGEVQRNVAETQAVLWHVVQMLDAEPDGGILDADTDKMLAARETARG